MASSAKMTRALRSLKRAAVDYDRGPHDAMFNAVRAASSPSNRATLERSLPTNSLIFPTALTIRQIVVPDAAGQRIPVAATLPLAPLRSFSSPLVQLDREAYTLLWRAFDAVQETGGSLSFAVN